MSVLFLALLIPLAYTPIGQSERRHPFMFASLEDFLSSYLVVQDREVHGSLGDMLEWTGFATIERLYLPSAVPEDFEVYLVLLAGESASISYLPAEDMVSEEAAQAAQLADRHFSFSFNHAHRWCPDEYYGVDWQGVNSISWISPYGERLSLSLPSTHEFYKEGLHVGMDMPFFTKEQVDYLTRATYIDLADTDAVLAMIGDGVRLEDLQFSAIGFYEDDVETPVTPTPTPPSDVNGSGGISWLCIGGIVIAVIVVGGGLFVLLLLWKCQ